MTAPNSPMAPELEKLMKEFSERACTQIEHHDSLDAEEAYDDAFFLATEGLRVLAALRVCQAENAVLREEHEEMRQAILEMNRIHLEASTRPGGYVSVSSQLMCDKTWPILSRIPKRL